ncbi:MAG: hypothetical protein ABJK11_04530 [Balneola sp.]
MKIILSSLFIFSSLLLFLTSCSNNDSETKVERIISNPKYGTLQNSASAPFEFELLDSVSIQLPNDFILSRITNLATDQNGNYYFMDKAQSKLISVSSDGSLRWMTGEKGTGPGDFENVWDILILNNSILVSNINSSRLDYFDFEGNFIKSIPMTKEISFSSIEGITESGNLVVSGPRWGSFGHHIFIVKPESDSLTVINSFEIDETNGIKIPENFTAKSEINVIDDQIITGSIHNYSFTISNLEGEKIKTINRDFDKIVRPGMFVSGNSSTMNSFGMVLPPFKIDNNLYLASAIWPTNVSDPDEFTKKSATGSSLRAEFENSIDLFDSNWNLLYSLESEGYDPKMGRIRFVKDGYIFTANTDPSPTIYRYKISTQN